MAANPLRGEAMVPGTELKLTFDVNAFCLAELALGKTTDVIVDEFETMRTAAINDAHGSANFPLMRGLFWAALQKHRDCTLEEAAELMSDCDLGSLRAALGAGMMAAFGVAKEGDADPLPNLEAGTG